MAQEIKPRDVFVVEISGWDEQRVNAVCEKVLDIVKDAVLSTGTPTYRTETHEGDKVRLQWWF